MKNWNWLLIAWYLIPILGWLSIIFLIKEMTVGWYLLIATVIWIFICLVWGLLVTRSNEMGIYQDALINRKLGEKDEERSGVK